MSQGIKYHTRHIPREHLDMSTQTGLDVDKNGLCDVLEPDNISFMRDQGVEIVELRLVWWELEREKGVFDWSRFERDLKRVEDAGLKAGLMAWFNHPPEWYANETDTAERFSCLEHGEDSTLLSLWDPKTLDIYDRLYKAVAEKYGDRLDFVYFTSSGDYGEPVLPQGVKHYKFSSSHGHCGLWTGDSRARQSFREWLEKEYMDIKELNAAWESSFNSWGDDFTPELPFEENNLRRKYDTIRWQCDSTMNFFDQVAQIIRKYFPAIPAACPIGHHFETWHGQIKSVASKIAAKYNLTARWTGMAVRDTFEESNMLARRIASAAHFYGAPFGEEAALILDEKQSLNAIYEFISNGGSMLHNDIGNIQRSLEVQNKLGHKIIIDPPASPIAVFYPLEIEMISGGTYITGKNKVFVAYEENGVKLRRKVDFDICDSIMINDGYLSEKSDLLFICDNLLDDVILPRLENFIADGGRIWTCGGSDVKLMNSGDTLVENFDKKGIDIFRDVKSREKGLYIVDDTPEFEVYESLKRQSDTREFITIHKKHISRFIPENCSVEIEYLNQ